MSTDLPSLAALIAAGEYDTMNRLVAEKVMGWTSRPHDAAGTQMHPTVTTYVMGGGRPRSVNELERENRIMREALTRIERLTTGSLVDFIFSDCVQAQRIAFWTLARLDNPEASR